MPNIEAISSNHHHQIAELLTCHYGKSEDFWLQRFNTWWLKNPAFNDLSEAGWVILDNKRKIVGVMGNIPTRMTNAGETIVARNGTSWFTLPAHRGLGMHLFFHLLRSDRSPVFVTTPNETTLKILTSLKVSLAPRANAGEKKMASFIPLHSQSLWEDITLGQNKQETVLHVNDTIEGKISDTRHDGKDVLQPDWVVDQLSLRDTTHVEIREINSAGFEFDRLWKKTQNDYSFTNVRDAAYINWMVHNTNHNHLVLGCFLTGEIVGFAIVKISQRKQIFRFVDLWLRREYWENAMSALIKFSVSYAHESSFKMVVIPHFHHSFTQKLTELGLPKIEIGDYVDYLHLPKEMNSEIHGSNTYFCDLQGDNDIW